MGIPPMAAVKQLAKIRVFAKQIEIMQAHHVVKKAQRCTKDSKGVEARMNKPAKWIRRKEFSASNLHGVVNAQKAV